jgi:hypothetical protein
MSLWKVEEMAPQCLTFYQQAGEGWIFSTVFCPEKRALDEMPKECPGPPHDYSFTFRAKPTVSLETLLND